MSDPFVKDNPWTLGHMALSREASTAGLLVEGKVEREKEGPLSIKVEQMRLGNH